MGSGGGGRFVVGSTAILALRQFLCWSRSASAAPSRRCQSLPGVSRTHRAGCRECPTCAFCEGPRIGALRTTATIRATPAARAEFPRPPSLLAPTIRGFSRCEQHATWPPWRSAHCFRFPLTRMCGLAPLPSERARSNTYKRKSALPVERGIRRWRLAALAALVSQRWRRQWRRRTAER